MSQQIIIFAGPDMCGKTEISLALSRILGIPRFKASTEHDSFLNKQDKFVNQLRYSDTRMVDFLAQTGHSVIFDRAFPCEYAYSRYFKRQTDFNTLQVVDEAFGKLGTKVIVCYRSSYDGIVDDLNPELKAEQLRAIEEHYRAFAMTSDCEFFFLNVDDEDLSRECSDILTFLGYGDESHSRLVEQVRASR